ncbi:hypothetical protein C7M84_002852 [Penaeus vannamei]|uniref:Uncharacterized protein n=1 Tax=Penaeus vannamei TaxID=6689 RepID=A0A3R7P8G8_PENVA|nr:hypothetical protein C7M84_002852 [Penaeus vannamei]
MSLSPYLSSVWDPPLPPPSLSLARLSLTGYDEYSAIWWATCEIHTPDSFLYTFSSLSLLFSKTSFLFLFSFFPTPFRPSRIHSPPPPPWPSLLLFLHFFPSPSFVFALSSLISLSLFHLPSPSFVLAYLSLRSPSLLSIFFFTPLSLCCIFSFLYSLSFSSPVIPFSTHFPLFLLLSQILLSFLRILLFALCLLVSSFISIYIFSLNFPSPSFALCISFSSFSFSFSSLPSFFSTFLSISILLTPCCTSSSPRLFLPFFHFLFSFPLLLFSFPFSFSSFLFSFSSSPFSFSSSPFSFSSSPFSFSSSPFSFSSSPSYFSSSIPICHFLRLLSHLPLSLSAQSADEAPGNRSRVRKLHPGLEVPETERLTRRSDYAVELRPPARDARRGVGGLRAARVQ